MKIFKVGGCVRDELIGVKSKDIDYAVECGSFEEMREHIARIGTIFLEKPEFLTIRAKVNGEFADYVMCRKDGYYSDGRRPDQVFPGTIFDDLSRRDFTINAIAIDTATGEYYDPFNGAADLKLRKIVCVRSVQRLEEDPLRILRAIRFAITKNLRLDTSIVDFLQYAYLSDMLKTVSVERIREELQRCFAYNTVATLYYITDYNLAFLFENQLWLKPTLEER